MLLHLSNHSEIPRKLKIYKRFRTIKYNMYSILYNSILMMIWLLDDTLIKYK